mmetsp:Transcript_62144/g.117813  ORF Transcript_62144/g.117813 Transcript_62144/m.117813 type:complete len:198 (-) Transcript_62144:66-659(-)
MVDATPNNSPLRMKYHDQTLDLRTRLHLEVCKTQRLYAKTLSQTRLTADLLRNPTVSLIKAVFMELSRLTGCGVRVFTDEELANVGLQAGIDNKMIFLSKLIYFNAMVLGEEPAGEEQVRILAHDALQKNRLLQKLHEVATSPHLEKNWPEAELAAVEHGKPKPEPPGEVLQREAAERRRLMMQTSGTQTQATWLPS